MVLNNFERQIVKPLFHCLCFDALSQALDLQRDVFRERVVPGNAAETFQFARLDAGEQFSLSLSLSLSLSTR